MIPSLYPRSSGSIYTLHCNWADEQDLTFLDLQCGGTPARVFAPGLNGGPNDVFRGALGDGPPFGAEGIFFTANFS